jgi:hypothetical protein
MTTGQPSQAGCVTTARANHFVNTLTGDKYDTRGTD